MQRAAGRMGWDEERFWFSTPSYFLAAVSEFSQQEIVKYRAGWEQSRMIAYAIWGSQGAKVAPADIIALPWIDKPKKALEWTVTKEELDKFSREADEIMAKIRKQQAA